MFNLVEENEIDRPDDFVVKSIANRSTNKIFIIQSIDRQMALEDIAAARGLTMEELLTEIEAIVDAGTKLNLNYYIEEKLDEDVVEDLYAWFRDEATSASLQEAMDALSEDYEPLEIRLVRVQFISEVAN